MHYFLHKVKKPGNNEYGVFGGFSAVFRIRKESGGI
jgi:hypothetical protein